MIVLPETSAPGVAHWPRARRAGQSMPWLLPAACIGLLALVWFSTIGMRALVSPDEGRYASLSLGMLHSGDWITPRLNGILYFEKPVLQYWLGALAFKLFGVSEFAARLWPALAGFLTVLAVGFTAGRLWGRETGLRALAICASMTWVLGNSLYLTLDAGLTLWLTLALCTMLLARDPATDAAASRHWVLAAWVAMALAVLTKGLVGLLIPGATLVILSLWERDLSWWRGMRWLPGSLLFLAITAPWFVAVSMRNPDFARFFFIHEHFTRFLTHSHHREGAWWYYVPLLLAGALPWTGALALPVFRPAQPEADDVRAVALRSQRRALLAWAGFVFLFFSVSGSKLPSYILPMFPALALLVAERLRTARSQVVRGALLVPIAMWLLALLASTQASRFTSANSPLDVIMPMAHAVRAGAGLFLLGAVAAWLLLRRERTTSAIWSLALCHIVATLVVLQSHDSFGQLKSGERPAHALASYLDANTPVFAVRSYDQTLPFYLRRDIVLADYEDEFELGQGIEPGKSLQRIEDFVARWAQAPKAAAYMSQATWQELAQRGVPMRVVYRDTRRVVVVKP
ncbi:4-amino-4-deoxy-L-arabinose transferase [Variovorax sp. OV329]|nr:4-amino-4-deoxy-L-arabinose transferase [Variovorax sp. OV329]